MRFVSCWHTIAVGLLLAAAFQGSQLRADDAGTLKFLETTPAPPAGDDASAAAALPAARPLDPMPIASIAPETTTLPPPAPRQAATTPPAPAPVFPRPGAAARVITQPFVEPQVTNQTRQALSFYGGYSARATLSQLPRRAPLQPSSPRPIGRQPKPFDTIHHEPTVSPYMNLHRNEDNDESAPNYFAFVRPQMEQLETARLRQREIQQLHRQLQGVYSTAAGPPYPAGGMPGTGTAARYMDTAQFYAGWRR